jgi:hypothetical protein
MNDELKTKEYLRSLESLTLADSSRLRMREELRSFAQFHTTAKIAAPIKSPFSWLLLKPVQAAFAFVLVLGAGTALYLGEDGTYNTPTVATIESPIIDGQSTTSPSETETRQAEESPQLAVAPEAGANPPDSPAETVSQDITMRSAAKQESADMTSDGMMMTTMVSQGEMNIDEFKADIVLREKTYRALIKKYETELGVDTTAELTKKLNTVASLLKDAEGKEETEARSLLDIALSTTGEIESTLSLLGTVTVENGVIIDIDLATEVPE